MRIHTVRFATKTTKISLIFFGRRANRAGLLIQLWIFMYGEVFDLSRAQFGKFEYNLQSIFGKFDYDLLSILKKFKHVHI